MPIIAETHSPHARILHEKAQHDIANRHHISSQCQNGTILGSHRSLYRIHLVKDESLDEAYRLGKRLVRAMDAGPKARLTFYRKQTSPFPEWQSINHFK